MTSNPTIDLGVSKNNGIPKSSILIGFSIINHPFWGTPIFGNAHLEQNPEVRLRLQADRHAEFTRGQEVSKRLSVGRVFFSAGRVSGKGGFSFQKKKHGWVFGGLWEKSLKWMFLRKYWWVAKTL